MNYEENPDIEQYRADEAAVVKLVTAGARIEARLDTGKEIRGTVIYVSDATPPPLYDLVDCTDLLGRRVTDRWVLISAVTRVVAE